MLEALEDRNLLSTSPAALTVPAPLYAEAEQYAAQAVTNYTSHYEQTVSAARLLVANLEQQALATAARLESTAVATVVGFIDQILFPTAQSSSTVPGQPGDQSSHEAMPTSSLPKNPPTATPIGQAPPLGGASPADGTAPSASDFSPSQISQAYGFNQITFNNGSVKGDGSGQTIAIVDAYNQPNLVQDLQTFDSYYGIAAPPSFTRVNQNGGSTLPGGNEYWDKEETADVELAHALAPGAKIVLVEANSNQWTDMSTAVNTARNLAGVSVVSMSWTFNEGSPELNDDSYFTTPSGHNGITFVAATGDKGSTQLYYPATSPNVLAVGGTVLTTDSSGDYQSEQGWINSGGGISAYESQPSYQKGVVTQSSTMRTVPDVALHVGNYAVYDTYTGGGWQPFAGTSAATPIWSALVAIADQGRALNGAGTLDGPSQTLPAIYQMPSSNFHDITQGNNGYNAGTGYDLVTGRGTPIANLVVNSLVAYDSSFWQQVPLASYYNRNGLTWGGTPISGGGLDGANDALAAQNQFTYQGTNFSEGPANAKDVVSAAGQTINLQAGNYSTLELFATAVNGNQTSQPFTIVYSDGSTQTFTQSLTDWHSAPGQYSDEIRVLESYAYNPDGSVMSQPGYFSAYALPLDPAKTIKSIILPNDANVEVVGMLLA